MKKILAMKWRRLGDTVLWTSALQALKEMGCDLHLCYPKEYQDLFHHDSRFPNQYLVSNGSVDNVTVEQLKKAQFDYVLNFHASPSSAKFAKSLGGKKTVIHSHDRNPNTMGSQIAIPHLGKPMRATERDLNVVRAIGWSGHSPKTLIVPKNFKRTSNTVLKPRLFLAPRASRSAKEWSQDRYLQLANNLKNDFELFTLGENLTTWGDRYLREELYSIAPPIATPTLSSLMEVLLSGTYLIGSDSGVKHLAIALGLKTLTLFGPESIGEWHCYDNQKALQIPVSCRDQNPEHLEYRWCGVEQCPLASHSCMSLITVEQVAATIRSPF